MQKEIEKKIFILTVDFPPMPGGMAQHCFDVVAALKLKGEKPVVIAPNIPEHTQWNDQSGVSVVRLKTVIPGRIFDNYCRTLWAYAAVCLRYCAAGNVRAVVANTWSIAGVAGLVMKKLFRVPYFVFAHGLDIGASRSDKKVSWLMKTVLSEAAAVIPNSSFTALMILQKIPSIALKVVHPALDTKRLESSEGRVLEALRGKRVILTVARLVESKGHADVIRALPKVIEHFPDIIYCIVGDGPQIGVLCALAESMHMNGHVVFAGNVPAQELPCYYKACDVFVLCSKQIPQRGELEGFGIVFLEAAFFAKPVIASRSGGIADAVIDGQTGILVEPSYPDGIAVALIRLLLDENMRAAFGRNAQKRVLSEFSLNNFADKLKGIINDGLVEKK